MESVLPLLPATQQRFLDELNNLLNQTARGEELTNANHERIAMLIRIFKEKGYAVVDDPEDPTGVRKTLQVQVPQPPTPPPVNPRAVSSIRGVEQTPLPATQGQAPGSAITPTPHGQILPTVWRIFYTS